MNMIPQSLEEQKALLDRSSKDIYETKFAFFPVFVKKSDHNWYTGGRFTEGWIWLKPYYYYNGGNLSRNYKFYVDLPPGVWYPGLEYNPFVVLRKRPQIGEEDDT